MTDDDAKGIIFASFLSSLIVSPSAGVAYYFHGAVVTMCYVNNLPSMIVTFPDGEVYTLIIRAGDPR